MKNLRDVIVRWADARVDELIAAPRMWGSHEAVEMQVLQTLEMRALALRPAQQLDDPRQVIEMYGRFLQRRYPGHPPTPLFELVEGMGEAELTAALSEFRGLLTEAMLPENPFEHSALVIRLTFEAGCAPTASAFSGFYEEFRRAARAAVRDEKASSMGRSKREIEETTDFTLEDVTVSPPNGKAGEVLLRLGASRGQQDWEAQDRVRGGLTTMLTLAEWADGDEGLEALQIDDSGQRTRAAQQTLRLLPPKGMSAVAIGGQFISRPKPVDLLPRQERRFLEVVGADAQEKPFDETDEIRAIDLDRGYLLLGKSQRVRCFAKPSVLSEVRQVGVRARIVGTRYAPALGAAFVMAQEISVEGGEG